MQGWERGVYLLLLVGNAGILLATALVAFLVALSPRTRGHRPAAWLLFAASTGVFVMNAILLVVVLIAAPLIGALGFDGYMCLLRSLLVVEWPIAILVGVALLKFRTGRGNLERHGSRG